MSGRRAADDRPSSVVSDHPSVSASLIGVVAAGALDLAFPARCAGCSTEGKPICRACLPALDARLNLAPGVPIGLPASIPAPLLQLEWCASFSGTVRRALHELKYAGEQRLAAPLGAAIARRWRHAGAGGDIVVHVPVSSERLRQRGYDQARLLAAVAAESLGLPFVDALERHRMTAPQFELDRSDRAGNVAGAFRVREPGGTAIAGRWVVLVDDVATTGATLAACGEALLEGGALAVSAITMAREG
jgi:ComF family protein